MTLSRSNSGSPSRSYDASNVAITGGTINGVAVTDMDSAYNAASVAITGGTLSGTNLNVTRIYLPVPRLDSTNASAALSSVGAMRGITLADAQNYHLGAAVDFPPDWNTYSVKVQFVNRSSAVSGNVCLRIDTMTLIAGTDVNGAPSSGTQAAFAASSTQWLLTEATVAANVAVNPAGPNLVRLIRLGNDATDTLAADISVIGLILTKVS